MRYTAMYVDSVRKWAVIDTLADDFVLDFFATERDARVAAGAEENRWSEILADTLPAAD